MTLISLLLQCIAYALCVIEALEYDPTSPLCGSDGRTYDTTVDLHHAQLRNPKLSAVHAGRCHGESSEDLSFFYRYKDLDAYDLCPTDYTPVCGTDGKTYNNECHLNSNKANNPELAILHKRKCRSNNKEEKADCLYYFKPVCGTDGITYYSKCFLDQERRRNKKPRLLVRHEGSCKKSANEYDVPMCTLDYVPVCGSDGTTYGNLCSLDANKKYHPRLYLKYYGECTEGYDDIKIDERAELSKRLEECPLTGTKVCGSDGRTYANYCFYKVNRRYYTGLSVKYYGRCKEDYGENVLRENKNGWCTLIWLPVCGTNEQTYGNICFLEQDKKKDPTLSINHYGPCEDQSNTSKKPAIRYRKLKPNRSVTQIDMKNGGKKENNININLSLFN